MPLRLGDDRRRYLWDLTSYWLRTLGWPIVTADDGSEPFNRAGSLNAAARDAGAWDFALLGDGDTYQDPAALDRALALRAPLVVPWDDRLKLSQLGTELFARRGARAVEPKHRDLRDGTSRTVGGGTLLVSRETWDAVGGMDETHRGYGNEDLAFVASVETLCIGGWVPSVEGRILHLWHPPHPRVGTRLAATPENQEKWRRYEAARFDPDATRELLAERDAARQFA